MSIKKRFILTTAPLLVVTVLAVAMTDGFGAEDPVLLHYAGLAKSAIEARNPLETGATYSFKLTSYYKNIGRKGEVAGIDSVVARNFYSWGKLDSQLTVAGNPARLEGVRLDYPNVFEQNYVLNSYPNDTGGPDLAIGFDTDSLRDPRPIGLVVIDRMQYYPRWMYLSYPETTRYERLSRSFRFVEMGGLLFVDSIWEVGAKTGIFANEHYRIETGITDIEISD